jgi:hypothetical protein
MNIALYPPYLKPMNNPVSSRACLKTIPSILKKPFLIIAQLSFIFSIDAQVKFITTGTFNTFQASAGLVSINTNGTAGLFHDFHVTDATTCNGVIEGPGGKLFGTTALGGVNHNGTVFSADADGNNFKVIYSAAVNEHINQSMPAFGPDGKLYIIIEKNLYRIQPDGSAAVLLTVMPVFSANKVVIDSVGWIYNNGSTQNDYILYKIKIDGTGFSIIHTFKEPEGTFTTDQTLCLTPTGRLYGIGNMSGADYSGNLFSLRTDGTDFVIHKIFDHSSYGASPITYGAVSYSSGKIFLATRSGGTGGNNGFGRIFSFDTLTSILTPIYDFTGYEFTPASHPILSGGRLTGFFEGGLFTVNLDGTNFQHMISNWSNRELLVASGSNKIFYTANPGAFKNGFLLQTAAPGLSAINIHDFGNVPDGYSPEGTTKGADGRLYGIARDGGTIGGGTLFTLKQEGGGFQRLHDFTGADGQVPVGRLLYATDGRLYGICSKSGAGGLNNDDLLFGMDINGNNYTVLHVFPYGVEGNVVPALMEGPGGQIFGSTTETVSKIFRINKNGTGFTVLKTFDPSGAEGRDPREALVYSGGYVYGVCAVGGSGANAQGTLFRVHENGTNFSVLHTFTFGGSEGYLSPAGIMTASNGKLYGTTWFGGTNGSGTVFTFNPISLNFQTIYNFDNNSDGTGLSGSKFLQATDNRLYLNKITGIFSIDTSGANPSYVPVAPFFLNYYVDLVEVPLNCQYCPGSSTEIKSSITGAGNTYQWQVNSGAGFIDLANDLVYSGVTTSTLVLSAMPSSLNKNEYRCTIHNGSSIIQGSKQALMIQSGWSGAVNTSWSNPLNWYCNQVPAIDANIIIQSGLTNYPVLNTNAACYSLTIQDGGQITVAPGISLQITGK